MYEGKEEAGSMNTPKEIEKVSVAPYYQSLQDGVKNIHQGGTRTPALS
jgi:hypothetical protein